MTLCTVYLIEYRLHIELFSYILLFSMTYCNTLLMLHSPAIKENRVTTVQCLSGTGSLRVGAEFLARHYHQVKILIICLFCFAFLNNIVWNMTKGWLAYLVLQLTIYIPQPTWGNHPKVFTLAGLSVKTYRYYDPATRGLNFQGEACISKLYLFRPIICSVAFKQQRWIFVVLLILYS